MVGGLSYRAIVLLIAVASLLGAAAGVAIAVTLAHEESPEEKCHRLINENIDKMLAELEDGKHPSDDRRAVAACESIPREARERILVKIIDERGAEIIGAALKYDLDDLDKSDT